MDSNFFFSSNYPQHSVWSRFHSMHFLISYLKWLFILSYYCIRELKKSTSPLTCMQACTTLKQAFWEAFSVNRINSKFFGRCLSPTIFQYLRCQVEKTSNHILTWIYFYFVRAEAGWGLLAQPIINGLNQFQIAIQPLFLVNFGPMLSTSKLRKLCLV